MLDNMDREALLRLLLKILIVLALCVTVIVACNYLAPVAVRLFNGVLLITLPLALAWVAAIITAPLTGWLRERKWPPALAAVLVLGAFFTLVGGALTAIGAYAAAQAPHLSRLGEQLLTQLGNSSGGGLLWQLVQKLWDDLAARLVPELLSWLQHSPTAVLFVILFLVATFFFCRDPGLPRRALVLLTPRRRREGARRLYDHLERIIGGWARAQLLLIAVSTALCLACYLILGVEGAWPLALLTGLLDLLPVVGPGTLLVPWAVYQLLSGGRLLGVSLLLFYVILVVVRNILEPKLVGDRIGLHPLAVLAAVFIGWLTLGGAGLVMGPLLLALGLAIYRLRT